MKIQLSPVYCSLCRKKLAFYAIYEGVIEIKCRMTSCRALNKITCQNGVCRQTFEVEKPPAYMPVVDNSVAVTT